MKWFFFLLWVAGLSSSISAASDIDGLSLVASNDVVWKTLGTNENDSMPIGNGDLAVNVWTEQNGDVMLLLSKADSWTEMGKLVKLGPNLANYHITRDAETLVAPSREVLPRPFGSSSSRAEGQAAKVSFSASRNRAWICRSKGF